MTNLLKVSLIALFITTLSGCAAFHSGYITDSTSLSQANFSYVNVSDKSYFDKIDDETDILLTSMDDTIIGEINTVEVNDAGRPVYLNFKNENNVRRVPVNILSNYRYNGVWKINQKTVGTATATYILGIGGLNRQALVEEAKSELKKVLPLSDNQAYVNITVNWKTSYIIFGVIMKVKCTVTADIVEFKK